MAQQTPDLKKLENMSNSSTQRLFCQNVVSGSFYWTTQYYHPDINFTMDDFLSNHLPREEAMIHHIEGAYAEIEYRGRDYGLHAGGSGDGFNHVIRWELL